MYDGNNYWFSEYDKYGLPTLLLDVSTGCILKVNQEVLSLLRIPGETTSSLEGRYFMDLNTLSDLGVVYEIEKIEPKFYEVVKSEKCTHGIIRFTNSGGVATPLGVTLFPVRDVDGKLDVVAVAIVPYGGAEDMSVIINLQKELEDEQNRSHLLIDSAPFGCIVLDKKFRPITCNAICVTLFQEKSKSSLLANLNQYFFAGETELKEFYQQIYQNLCEDGSFQMSATHITAEGGYFETSMTLSLLRYKGEDQIVVYLVDMSEQRKVLDMYAELAREASMDQLTGVKNRGHFDTKMRVMITEHRRTEKPLYLVMMDIDDFKKINDTYGHVIGDEVLKRLGSILCDNIRPVDIIARYGGEEFVILFENMTFSTIKKKVELLREAIAAMQIQLPCGDSKLNLRITVSIGLAQFNPATMKDGESLCTCADRALYRAKHAGKNCFCVYEE